MDKINICSLNTRGLDNSEKRFSVSTWLKKSNYNIIFCKKLIVQKVYGKKSGMTIVF